MTYDTATLKRLVLAKYPFFGSVLASVGLEETQAVRQIASDGKTIYFNPEYLAELTAEEQRFALAHEVCHIAFRHIERSRGKDREVWKNATDAVINQLLKRDGLQIPAGFIDYPEAIDYDAETYYELLLEHKLAIELIEGNMQKPSGAGAGEGGDEERKPGPGSTEDDHSMWEDALEQQEQEESQREEDLLRELEKIQEMTEEMDESEFEMLQQETQRGQNEDDDEDQTDPETGLIAKKESQGGNSVNPDLREIRDIGYAGPILDWRMLLRDTINYGVDWSLLHAVIEDGMIRPILEERPMPETEIVLDTSWSVEDSLLRNFLRECRNILQISKLKAGCFDTVFYGFHEIRTDRDIEEMEFEGGGGTDFEVAVNAFSRRVDNRIIFTDGEADIPEEALDVIWMVYGDHDIDPPGGRVIRITEEQLERLK